MPISMRSLQTIKIDFRALSVINFLLVGFWHFILLAGPWHGENTAALVQTLFYVLPLLAIILSCVLLWSREGGRWPYAAWLWPAVAVGFTPCVTFCLYVALSG
jgi:hypothetical protein